MKVIIPYSLDFNGGSSTVAEADYAAWNSGTTYAIGDRCIVTGTEHRIYESLVASNINNLPINNLSGVTPKWLDVGPTNRWAMLDSRWGTQTTATSSLTVTIAITGNVNSLALLNIDAEEITIDIKPLGGVSQYNNVFEPLAAPAVYSWYDYFFNDWNRVFKTDYVITDLPFIAQPVFTVTVKKAGTVKIGVLVIGQAYELGLTEYGASPEFIDYSTVIQDTTFGGLTLVPRKSVKKMQGTSIISNDNLDGALRTVASLAGKLAVWSADNDTHSFDCLNIYGVCRSFRPVIEWAEESTISFEILGVN